MSRLQKFWAALQSKWMGDTKNDYKDLIREHIRNMDKIPSAESGIRAPSDPALLPSLLVSDQNGNVLVDIEHAHKADYSFFVSVGSTEKRLDLYDHYLRFCELGGVQDYRSYAEVADSYEKFGHCIQDIRHFTILIQATKGQST